MNDKQKLEATTRGVTQAWDWWLHDHEVTAPGAVETGVQLAFDDWLVKNTDALIEAIAREVATNSHIAQGAKL